MDTWRVHQPLWKQDKLSWTDKFIAKSPPTSAYEERMARYTKNAAEIWRTAGNVDCSFVRIRTQTLAAAVRDEALGWVKALRDGMQALDLQTLQVLMLPVLSDLCCPVHNTNRLEVLTKHSNVSL